MPKNLIFLESATKKKTIQSFLGAEYVIFATGGHLWELKKTGLYNLGVDLEKFTPFYETIADKKNFINFWKSFLTKEEINTIYLATDPDREGEGIAYEIVKLLDLKPSQYQRLLFYEITPHNIRSALDNPCSLNQNLVEAQTSRQVLDRMIGFCISPLLQKIQKIQTLSAGRVQSVVLKLIVERELLIKKYEKKKDYILCGICLVNQKKAVLKQVKESGELIVYSEIAPAEAVKKELSLIFQLINQTSEKKLILPKSPLITSLLLFEAKSQLGLSVAQTTQIAQKLYEGIWIASQKKQLGLITYPRTDSPRINQEFRNWSYRYIKEKWGTEYCNFQPAWTKKEKKANVQGAHEAIHPTYLNYSPEEIKDSLTPSEYQVYKLIFDHSLASLMSPAQINKITYRFLNQKYYFQTNERIVQFAGFLACSPATYFSNYKVKLKSDLSQVTQLEAQKIEIQEYLENKPTRYNEGNLVQELERLGIGRPSTYNTFGRILLKRGYVELDKKGHFVPTALGSTVNQYLQQNFASLINENYTAILENELDKISQGQNSYYAFIKNFWTNLTQQLKALT
ncbi:MAG: type I DNA topoisomerase [Candidatus Moeniiplasma glomeromycotorum]|nr:type I DNA topoisomerase [Candidatus Moeniiplasma glomeromycotorum]MCE8167989.1 type I DNA topoisomerase [Candidatus Moeniiplasma glomeromycotorum]MCE8169518.1 type I DNA topoisomerase [Candidatus Moeniiplasma glomeromycotorum]